MASVTSNFPPESYSLLGALLKQQQQLIFKVNKITVNILFDFSLKSAT